MTETTGAPLGNAAAALSRGSLFASGAGNALAGTMTGDPMQILQGVVDLGQATALSLGVAMVKQQGRTPNPDKIGLGNVKQAALSAAEAPPGPRNLLIKAVANLLDPEHRNPEIRKEDLTVLGNLSGCDALWLHGVGKFSVELESTWTSHLDSIGYTLDESHLIKALAGIRPGMPPLIDKIYPVRLLTMLAENELLGERVNTHQSDMLYSLQEIQSGIPRVMQLIDVHHRKTMRSICKEAELGIRLSEEFLNEEFVRVRLSFMGSRLFLMTCLAHEREDARKRLRS